MITFLSEKSSCSFYCTVVKYTVIYPTKQKYVCLSLPYCPVGLLSLHISVSVRLFPLLKHVVFRSVSLLAFCVVG